MTPPAERHPHGCTIAGSIMDAIHPSNACGRSLDAVLRLAEARLRLVLPALARIADELATWQGAESPCAWCGLYAGRCQESVGGAVLSLAQTCDFIHAVRVREGLRVYAEKGVSA